MQFLYLILLDILGKLLSFVHCCVPPASSVLSSDLYVEVYDRSGKKVRGGEGGKVKDLHTLKIGSNLDSSYFIFLLGLTLLNPVFEQVLTLLLTV